MGLHGGGNLDNLPVISGMVRDKSVEVLQDSECNGVIDSKCNGVIVRRELLSETDFTQEVGHMIIVDQTIKKIEHCLDRR